MNADKMGIFLPPCLAGITPEFTDDYSSASESELDSSFIDFDLSDLSFLEVLDSDWKSRRGSIASARISTSSESDNS